MKHKKVVLVFLLITILAIGPFWFSTVHAGFFDLVGNLVNDLLKPITKFIAKILLEIGSFIIGLGALILNQTLQYTVVNMSSNINGVSSISIAWTVIRDVINMSLIFILLYVAIGTILGIGGVNWKRNLIGVVVVALFINFSLFLTKALVDASNLLALTFYDKIAPTAQTSATGGLADSFIDALKVQTLYQNPSSALQNAGSYLIIGILGFVFMLIAALVFVAVSIMFLIRFVNIVLLLILSPVGFFGSLLPGISGSAKKWWSTLMGELLFAPLYMILTWIVVVIISDPGFIGSQAVGGGGTLAGGLSSSGAQPSASSIDLAINFIVVLILMIATLVLSRGVSGQGGTVGARVVGTALGGLAGAGAYGARRTFGAYGRKKADDEKLKERAAQKGWRGAAARLQLRTGQALAKGSMDIRKPLDKAGGAFELGDFGIGKAGGKGGYDEYLKKKAEKERKFAESLKPSDITIMRAEQAVEDTKKIDTSDQGFRGEQREEYVRRQNRVRGAERELEKAETDYRVYQEEIKAGLQKADPKLVKYHRDQVEEKRRELEQAQAQAANARSAERFKLEKVQQAQTRIDELKGISPDEAKNRQQRMDAEMKRELDSIDKTALEAAEALASNLQQEVGQLEEELKKAVLPESQVQIKETLAAKKGELEQASVRTESLTRESEATEKRIKETYARRREEIKPTEGAEKRRAWEYADVISTGRTGLGRLMPDTNRVMLFGKIKRGRLQGAANIRKGKRPPKEVLSEALKQAGFELKDIEPQERTAPMTSTPATGSSTTTT